MSKEKKTTIPFIVESGNWKIGVTIDHTEDEVLTLYSYIEAATLAVEFIYGKNEIFGNSDFYFYELLDDDGNNCLDDIDDDTIDDVDTPPALFGIITACYLEKDMNKKDKWCFFVTSQLFANAAQPENVEIAKKTLDDCDGEIKKIVKTQFHALDETIVFKPVNCKSNKKIKNSHSKKKK